VYLLKGNSVIKGLNTAENAMMLEQNRIDALANNLANVNTAGFKQILTRVAEVAGTRIPGEGTEAGSPGRAMGSSAPRLQMYHALDNRPGSVQATGRATDVAVMGEGYFEIKTPNGPAFTRHGSFLMDADQNLTTPDGFGVMGERGPISLRGTDFSIANNGAIMVDGKAVDRLKLVVFEDPSRLQHLGGSLVVPPQGMDTRNLEPAEVVVAQGHLEGSNVNPIDTLIAMIAAQRAFEVQSKVMTTEDEMLEKSVNNLPRISG
jgi:flagellar basal-body rod protein FlgF